MEITQLITLFQGNPLGPDTDLGIRKNRGPGLEWKL
jgi:hypothetical protein